MSSSLIRQDLVPMVAGYVLIMGTLAIGLRLVRRSASRDGTAAAGQPNSQQVSAAAPGPVPAPTAAATVAAGTANGRARLRSIVRPGPGWRRLALHSLGTAVGGYLLLMVVIIAYYHLVAPVAGNFVESAFSGCAMLIGLAAPVWIALSWLTERKGWRL
jgi:Family of unknown function (DUF6256)